MARDTSGLLLKRTNGNELLASLQRFFNQQMSRDHIIQTVKEMMGILPDNLTAVIIFALLMGLRASEACESVKLLNSKGMSVDIPYYNPDQQILQHYCILYFLRGPSANAIKQLQIMIDRKNGTSFLVYFYYREDKRNQLHAA